MSTEQDKRNTEVTKKTGDKPQEPFDKQNPNEPVEAAEKNLEKVQDNQRIWRRIIIRILKLGRPRISAPRPQTQRG